MGALIKIIKDGPAIVSSTEEGGEVKIVNNDGTTIDVLKKATICTCGLSKNGPFCDGSHRQKT
jgi:CDGSH-type Zn-finger protein